MFKKSTVALSNSHHLSRLTTLAERCCRRSESFRSLETLAAPWKSAPKDLKQLSLCHLCFSPRVLQAVLATQVEQLDPQGASSRQ